MMYNLKKVVSIYVKRYYEYLKKVNLLNECSEALYDLFSYTIKNIYALPACESNYFIDQYGEDCINYLKKSKGVPKRVKRLSVNDRLSIVTMCNSYFVAVKVVCGTPCEYEEI